MTEKEIFTEKLEEFVSDVQALMAWFAYNGWDEARERELFNMLSGFLGKFNLSTWHHNDYREADAIHTFRVEGNVWYGIVERADR